MVHSRGWRTDYGSFWGWKTSFELIGRCFSMLFCLFYAYLCIFCIFMHIFHAKHSTFWSNIPGVPEIPGRCRWHVLKIRKHSEGRVVADFWVPASILSSQTWMMHIFRDFAYFAYFAYFCIFMHIFAYFMTVCVGLLIVHGTESAQNTVELRFTVLA